MKAIDWAVGHYPAGTVFSMSFGTNERAFGGGSAKVQFDRFDQTFIAGQAKLGAHVLRIERRRRFPMKSPVLRPGLHRRQLSRRLLSERLALRDLGGWHAATGQLEVGTDDQQAVPPGRQPRSRLLRLDGGCRRRTGVERGLALDRHGRRPELGLSSPRIPERCRGRRRQPSWRARSQLERRRERGRPRVPHLLPEHRRAPGARVSSAAPPHRRLRSRRSPQSPTQLGRSPARGRSET